MKCKSFKNGKINPTIYYLKKKNPAVWVWRDLAMLTLNFSGFLALEFFELISKVQSNRADDQRGLLRKEDLVLPDFLHLPSGQVGVSTSAPKEATGSCPRTPRPDSQEKRSEDGSCPPHPSDPADGQRGPEKPLRTPVALSQATGNGTTAGTAPRPPNLLLQGSPRWKEEVETVEEENVVLADLTLVAEGDIGSPNSGLIPSERVSPTEAKATSEKFRPGIPRC